MKTLYADYGYDVHSIRVSDQNYKRIKKGDAITVKGQGFVYHGEGWVKDVWHFHSGAVEISLENGADVHCKEWWE